MSWKIKLTVLILFVSCLLGCQAPPIKPQNIALTTSNSSLINIYRPGAGFVGAGVEYRVFYNGDYIGILRHGGSLSRRVVPGRGEITFKGYALGLPDLGSGESTEIYAEKGKDYYLRLGNRLDGIYLVGSVASATSTTTLTFVTKQQWLTEH